MQWRIFQPSGTGPWPAVLVIHEGGFKGGGLYDGNLVIVARDLQTAGYYTLIVNYRLAPCGIIPGQHQHDTSADGIASGRPPQQSNDIKALVRAITADTAHCKNGLVAVVGGSAGGMHGVQAAVDINPTVPATAWPKWTASDRVTCAVCLSAPFNLSNPTNASVQFTRDAQNYTNSCEPSYHRSVSPVSLVPQLDANNLCKPLYLINGDNESMPVDQTNDMQCALTNNTTIDPALYQIMIIPNEEKHAFAYWDDVDRGPEGKRISEDVIQFLVDHLK